MLIELLELEVTRKDLIGKNQKLDSYFTDEERELVRIAEEANKIEEEE